MVGKCLDGGVVCLEGVVLGLLQMIANSWFDVFSEEVCFRGVYVVLVCEGSRFGDGSSFWKCHQQVCPKEFICSWGD